LYRVVSVLVKVPMLVINM